MRDDRAAGDDNSVPTLSSGAGSRSAARPCPNIAAGRAFPCSASTTPDPAEPGMTTNLPPTPSMNRRAGRVRAAVVIFSVIAPACLLLPACQSGAIVDPDAPQFADGEVSRAYRLIAQLAQSPSPVDAPTLTAGLGSSDPRVREKACEGLTVITPEGALPYLVRLELADPSASVRNAAERAVEAYPPADAAAARDAVDPVARARAAARDNRVRERYAEELRKLDRLEPPTDEATMKRWAAETAGRVGFFITDVSLVTDHAPPGHPLGYDGEPNAGELLEYAVSVRNASEGLSRVSSSVYCYTYDPHVRVVTRELLLPPVGPSGGAQLSPTLLILVAPNAPEEHTATFYLEMGDTHLDAQRDGRPVYRPFELTFTNHGVTGVSFNILPPDDDEWGASAGNDDGVSDWNEEIELTVEVANVGSLELREAFLTLTTPSRIASVRAVDPREGRVPPGGRPGFVRSYAVTLDNTYKGAFALPLTLELTVPRYPPPSRQINDRDPRPESMFVVSQRAFLMIGTNAIVLDGEPETYAPFSFRELVDRFVLGDDYDTQQRWLQRNQLDFLSERARLLMR
jgi:hypothetical protein